MLILLVRCLKTSSVDVGKHEWKCKNTEFINKLLVFVDSLTNRHKKHSSHMVYENMDSLIDVEYHSKVWKTIEIESKLFLFLKRPSHKTIKAQNSCSYIHGISEI